MRRKSERLKIDTNESAVNGGRTFIITLMAPASAFQLSDLLKQITVIESLVVDLNERSKERM